MPATQHSPQTVRALDALQAALRASGHGAKGVHVQRTAADLGVSVPTVHRWLQAHMPERMLRSRSRDEQRKRRADAGQRSIGRDELQAISAALLASFRRSGQRILTFDCAVQMLRDEGMVTSALSTSRIATLLQEAGLHPAQLTRPTPAVEQRSRHPNHVCQVDASVCVAYYLSNATGLQVMDEREFYKNKPKNLSRIQDERLIRYAYADHYSHEILARYYLGSECSASLCDFLIWCFAPKDGHPMHGVPFILQMDMGSANTSAPALNLLDRLGVRWMVHERHNSRANGSVEKAHHLVEVHFESALRFQRVQGLDDLNAKALVWSAHFGATHQHSRHGKTRHEVWMRIKPHELRLAPPADLMRTLPTSHPEERRVDNNLHIAYAVRGWGRHDYDLRYLPGVMPGQKVQVVVNGLLAPAVEVQYQCPETRAPKWLTVHPVQRDEVGFRLDAPIIGEELRTGARSVVDANRTAAVMQAFGGEDEKQAQANAEKGALAFGGRVDPFKRAREAALPAYMPRRGTPLQVAGRSVEAPRMSRVEAAQRVLDALKRLGRADAFGPHVRDLLLQRYGEDGVPDDALEHLVAELTGAAQATNAPLRAAGGAA
jgi:transposase